MDSLEKFSETLLPSIESFTCNLNFEKPSIESFYKIWKRFLNQITIRQKHFWNNSETKNLGQYSDLFVQSDTLVLCDIFKSFREICLKTFDLDANHFLFEPGLACVKTKIKLELPTNVNMLSMIKKRVRGGICHTIFKHVKSND